MQPKSQAGRSLAPTVASSFAARRTCVLSFVLAAGLLLPAAAHAATFTAACSGTTGDPSSVVTAITDANSDPGSDTVQLGAGCTYTFTAADSNWFGPDALPPITSTITIEGNGATIARSSVSGTPDFRLFFVAADPANPNTVNYVVPAGTDTGGGELALRDLTLSGGLAKGGDAYGGGGGAGLGGAIFSQGQVTLNGVTITQSKANGGDAGLDGSFHGFVRRSRR
jgi:hypothetical protein